MKRTVVRVRGPLLASLGSAIFIIGCCILALSPFVASQWIMERGAVATITGTVTDKYIKRVGDVDVYHVAIQDPETGHTEVLWNRDAYTWQKLNSADVQQALKVGQTYDFTVAGIRSPLFSLFRNIVQYQPHKDSR